jgi:beta-galactosidase/beta-glucuronidase
MNSILDLNGEWELLWDKDDAGVINRWYATLPEGGEKVQVPHVWEHAFEKLSLTQDTAYYFKRFFVDEKQVPKRIFLKFERIATHATFWLNGKLLGDHFGAYSPCIVDTSKAIKLGAENVLCVRVANMGSANSRIDFGRESREGANDRYVHPSEMPVGLPWQQYPFGGIYGNVSLVLGNAAFIANMQLEPDFDQERVAVEVAFNNPRGFQTRLRILMKSPSGQVSEMYKELKLEKENASHRFILGIKDWKKEKCAWTLETPNLFSLELQLEGKSSKGKDKSKVESSFSVVRTFGFRKF